jgi:FADH2 O2-dependent halogenase
MTTLRADVAVLGSGFAGSLTALLLERIGLQPVVIDRGSHPRFAIGESSTPIADSVLRSLALRYNLPRLAPLTAFGTWRDTYPQLVCGRKRGFSYFKQVPNHLFRPCDDHGNELLVAASSDDAHADTHWLRSDIDAFLAAEVQQAGIPFLDQTDVSPSPNDTGWELTGSRIGGSVRVRTSFVIDASGEAGVVLAALAIPSSTDGFATHSRAIYSHFAGVRPWHDLLKAAGHRVDDHPFYCDHAALHQLLDEGWMWQLRFENGVTSAGFVVDARQYPLQGTQSAEREWQGLLRRYPSVAEQFADARVVRPPGRVLQTGRLQRCASRMAGARWALLPNTAGFIDPLHSTGIAQTLCGIERLVEILGDHWEKPSLKGQLQQYEETLRREILLIDKLVSGCYLARRNHRLFVAFSMLYFAAATTYEHRRHARDLPRGSASLCADDPAFMQLVNNLWWRLQTLVSENSKLQLSRFEQQVAEAIAPYNRAGLCDPRVRNMYSATVAPRRYSRDFES